MMYLVGVKTDNERQLRKILRNFDSVNVFGISPRTCNILAGNDDLNHIPQENITGIFDLSNQLMTTVVYTRLKK